MSFRPFNFKVRTIAVVAIVVTLTFVCSKVVYRAFQPKQLSYSSFIPPVQGKKEGEPFVLSAKREEHVESKALIDKDKSAPFVQVRDASKENINVLIEIPEATVNADVEGRNNDISSLLVNVVAEHNYHDVLFGANYTHAFIFDADRLMLEFFKTRDIRTRDAARLRYVKHTQQQSWREATPTLIRIALIDLQSGSYKSAESIARDTLKHNQLCAKCWLVLGYALEALKKPLNEAKACFQKALLLGDASDVHYSMPKGYRAFMGGQFWPEYQSIYLPALMDVVLYHEWHAITYGQDPILTRVGANLADQESQNTIDAMSEFYVKNDFVIIKGLLSRFESQTLHRYYHEMLPRVLPNREQFVTSGVSERLGFWYNQRFQTLYSSIAAQMVYPTYSYFVNYLGKMDNPGLKPHLDAVDNEFTMSIPVTEHPISDPPWRWPIYIEKERKQAAEVGTWQRFPPKGDKYVVECDLQFGDGVLFRGRRHPHYRYPLALDREHGEMLSHFVDADYPRWLTRAEHNQRFPQGQNGPVCT